MSTSFLKKTHTDTILSGDYVVSGVSLISTLFMSWLGCPTNKNPAVTKTQNREPKTIVLRLSQSVNLPQKLVPVVCRVKNKPNLILLTHNYLACPVFCWQKDKTMYLPATTDLGGGWKRCAIEAGETGSVCCVLNVWMSNEVLNPNWITNGAFGAKF